MALPNLPIYVTRKTAAGNTGDYSLSPGLALTLMLLILANIAGWSIYGLVVLVTKVVSLLG